jgi:serine phosphatase RsbU (regulator of sigma subunit)
MDGESALVAGSGSYDNQGDRGGRVLGPIPSQEGDAMMADKLAARRATDPQQVTRRILHSLKELAPPCRNGVRAYVDHTREYSGDLLLCEHTPAGQHRIFVGDITDFGLSAAVVAIPACQTFLTMTRKGFDIPTTVAEINRNVHLFVPVGIHLDCCVIEIDPAGPNRPRVARIWNGGIPDVYLYRPGEAVEHVVAARGQPLGMLDSEAVDTSFEEYPLGAGSRILAMTDGLVNATGSAGECFGPRRIRRIMTGVAPQGDTVMELIAGLAEFTGNGPLQDDITLVDIAPA